MSLNPQKVLIVKNITREGPGLLAKVLKVRRIPFDQLDSTDAGAIPSLENYSAMIVLGGPSSANDKTPAMANLLSSVEKAIKQGLPYLGICLGMQVLVKAGGGRVMKNPVREIGLYDPEGRRFQVTLTSDGKKDPFIGKLSKEFPIFHLHGETVALGKNMKLLGVGKFCRHQIVKVGKRAYGFQGHLELTPEMLRSWLREDQGLMRLERKKVMDDFMAFYPDYQKRGVRVAEGFLKMAGILS